MSNSKSNNMSNNMFNMFTCDKPRDAIDHVLYLTRPPPSPASAGSEAEAGAAGATVVGAVDGGILQQHAARRVSDHRLVWAEFIVKL
jgi:hypothetical protein